MRKSILTTLSIVTALFVASCGNGDPQGKGNEELDQATTAVGAETVQLKDDILNAVYQEYLNVNLALVNSNVEEAKIAANSLALGAKELEKGGVIAERAIDITEAGALTEQREAFSELSDALIVLVKESGLASGNIYVDYCPMAMNNTGGYWLSSEQGIKNPYFGDSMLTCGETKETL